MDWVDKPQKYSPPAESPSQTDQQVVASGSKLNLCRDLRWVAKRTRKFPRNYMQLEQKKNILRWSILYFIG